MHQWTTGIAFVAALACGGSAFAVDQLITGKKLLITNPVSGVSGPANNKIVYLSKDTTIALPGDALEDPRCNPERNQQRPQITISSVASGETAAISLPCGNWTVQCRWHPVPVPGHVEFDLQDRPDQGR
jgi:hypothetical protein